MGDLNVRGGDWDQRSFDSVSNALLCNHNCWVLLRAFELANELAFESNASHVPAQWRDCLELIDGIFADGNWFNTLVENAEIFSSVLQSEHNIQS